MHMWSVNNAPYIQLAIAGQLCAKLEKSHVPCTHMFVTVTCDMTYVCLWAGVDGYIHVY